MTETYKTFLLNELNLEQPPQKKIRQLKNNTFRVRKEYFIRYFTPFIYNEKSEAMNNLKYVKADYDSKLKSYKEIIGSLKACKNHKEMLKFHLRTNIFYVFEKRDSLLYLEEAIKNYNEFLEEIEGIAFNSDLNCIEVKKSKHLSNLLKQRLEMYYTNLLSNVNGNKVILKDIEKELKTFDMVNKYKKQLINCKVVWY